MSKIFKNSSDKPYMNGNHKQYLSRIKKTLYYGRLPKNDCLSLPLTELAAEIFSEAKRGKSLERLHSYKAAEISRNACVAPCSLVLAILYLERLKSCNSQYLEKICPSDLFLVSLMISNKFLFDDGEGDEVFLDEWAKSGGINIKELIRLEKEFLSAIDWKIFISDEKFNTKLKEIEMILAIKQGIYRGNFTYTELDVLSPLIEINNLIQIITAVTAVLALTYVAGLMTIVGSVFLTSQIPGTSLYVKKLESSKNPDLVIPQISEPICEPETIMQTEFDNKMRVHRVVDMLKTSILLASIKSNATSYEITTSTNAENITWDYWNNPVMDWLAKSSEIVTSFTVDLQLNYLPYYLETTLQNMKYMDLQDQIHKASKTRIQDQIESSWHIEWIESIKFGVYTKIVSCG